ncbi:MAG TPA: 3-dehydroquinate synthase [Candidatus Acidoferrales bacterium]|nr:3-dehydroquinate synthase [Candidatus Acidoferrales bacterium]
MKVLDYRINSLRVPIYLGDSAAQIAVQLRSVTKPAVVVDSKVADIHKDLINEIGSTNGSVIVVFQATEENKCLEKVQEILTYFLERNIKRDSTLFAIGGGITGDMAGFVAAIFQRGINYVNVPTTLLAMVDSSIGGKVGVNHDLGKNMIGAFHQPVSIIMNTKFLETLPKDELVCGLGEIVKYAVLRGDRFFDFLEKNYLKLLNKDQKTFERMIKMSIETKRLFVERDAKESGIRAHLNLGHTIGHAIEAAAKYNKFKHGEAVLIGLVAESHIAMHMKLLRPTNFERILKMVRQIAPRREDKVVLEDVVSHLKYDKKVKAGKVRFVLPTGIGKVVIRDDVAHRNIVDSIKFVADDGLLSLN